METLRDKLAPLTEWIPVEFRDYLPLEAWWMIELVLALLVLLIVGQLVRSVLRKIHRALFHKKESWDQGLDAPLHPGAGPNPPALTVYQTPGWVRLIVLAPVGKQAIEPSDGPGLLRLLWPNLEEVASLDAPLVRIWPGQLSTSGFTGTFHRRTAVQEKEGQPSRWVFLAGKAKAGTRQIFVGLVVWMREPSTLGRINLEAHQWRDVLRPRLASLG